MNRSLLAFLPLALLALLALPTFAFALVVDDGGGGDDHLLVDASCWLGQADLLDVEDDDGSPSMFSPHPAIARQGGFDVQLRLVGLVDDGHVNGLKIGPGTYITYIPGRLRHRLMRGSARDVGSSVPLRA